MDNLEKLLHEKGCNCKNSKCIKLYCECFSARVPCGKNCHCLGCQNSKAKDIYPDKRHTKEIIKGNKGCACKRSYCTKKYCECYQSGVSCNQLCKCQDCRNDGSFTNIKVINQLRRDKSDISNAENSNLYPLYLSQNSDHLKSIIKESNPFDLEKEWLENVAKKLYLSTLNGSIPQVLKNLIQILSILEQNINGNKVQQSQVNCQTPIQDSHGSFMPYQQVRWMQEQLKKIKQEDLIKKPDEKQVNQWNNKNVSQQAQRKEDRKSNNSKEQQNINEDKK